MTLIRKWALALCLVLLCSNYSNAQNVDTGSTLSSTGNVLNLGQGLPWTGTVAGQSGGTSGGPTPAYNSSTGNIIFSYSTRTVSQAIAINQALASVGSNVQIGGYAYQWQIQNDINTGGSNRGTLTGNVSLTGPSGNVLESFNYDYNQNLPSFTVFRGTQLFENQYTTAAASNITVSFTGKDKTFWAGYYGPRVHVDSFSLLYTAAPTPPTPPTVNPCTSNQLSSPSCPGYGAAFITKTNAVGSTSIVSIPSTIINLVTPDNVPTSVTNVGGVQLSTTGNISVPDGIPQSLKDVQSVVQQSQPQQTQQQSASSSAQTQQQSNKSAPNMSLIMNLIGQIQAADKATQTAAVQNANQVAATSSAKAQEQAMATVDNLNAMSMASSQASQIQTASTAQMSAPPAQPTSTSAVQLQGPTTTSLQSLMTASTQSMNSTNVNNTSQQTNQISYQAPANSNSVFSIAAAYSASKSQTPTYNEQQLSSLLSIQQTVAETAPVQMTRIETRSLDAEVPVMLVASAMPRGSSVTEIAETRANIETAQTEQSTETVKKNVQPNELAGGVDIASIATQPKGFDVYATTIMKDGAFYAPKDIYGNQKTIDNARALRSLSSDRLHQEMIDLQYRR